ncbi:hypothetical protein [Arcanobacterium buesumense]|uniref:Uncharacterized protein n=1 Tax=Arcanobacterium buesumense TaxID=2722751 RepID=A0A6H2EJ95_9ACTO|nr:hypothetical protein [Arcanobacterium buesumense]QJC21638.1 hypothetical protein HC352_03370 [Arcanobacterium buesumense]
MEDNETLEPEMRELTPDELMKLKVVRRRLILALIAGIILAACGFFAGQKAAKYETNVMPEYSINEVVLTGDSDVSYQA